MFPDFFGRIEWSGSYKKQNSGKGNISTSMLNEILTKQQRMDKEIEELKDTIHRECREARERNDHIIARFYAMQRGEGTSVGGDGGSGGGGGGGDGDGGNGSGAGGGNGGVEDGVS